jgi:hypothetical protein
LDEIRDALVGIPGVNGLSTEQRKRLTIAVELVSNPSIIFMDEPTAGLDARAAGIVMRAVKNVAETGRTVVCTIHQPNIEIFEAFDEAWLKFYILFTIVRFRHNEKGQFIVIIRTNFLTKFKFQCASLSYFTYQIIDDFDPIKKWAKLVFQL